MQTATFGTWLKARRKALDLTRVQLASQVGCAEITLEKIERDQRRPSKQIAELLAKALRVPDASCDQFVQFARGVGEPPLFGGTEQHANSAKSQPLTNLPAPLTSFIDRTSELAAVQSRLSQLDVRLLTLVGPPGIGKTRLSIQVGQAVLNQFPDGVWFVALAPISDPTNVLSAIARVFDIADAGATPLLTRVQDHLQPKHLLLLLDNFDQVLDATPVVTDLLKACPRLKVLVTSREPLHAYGEHEYPMPALSLPPRNKSLAVEQLAEFDAVKLFVARAQACQPDFALSAGNAQAVTDICLRLDGLPLAIELAASRLRQFTLPKLRDALQTTPLQALVGTARDAEPRQRTLRSAIQWSYDLLDEGKRMAFARLGVFVGGCSTEAALAVCELADDASLHALADRNLLKREIGGDANERWAMLEMIREFALEQLPNDEMTQARQRHAEYFARILQFDYDESWHVIDVEQHNARAALRWLLDHKHSLTGELALFMGLYFEQAGLQNEGRRMLPAVLSSDIEMAPLTRSDLLGNALNNARQQHRFEEGLRYAHEALALSHAINAQQMTTQHLIGLSRLYIEMDDCAQAKQVALEALEIGHAIQNPDSIVGALATLGRAELMLGNMGVAEAYLEEAYALCQSSNWLPLIYAVLACQGMGEIALSCRKFDPALRFLREGLERAKITSTKLRILDALAGVIRTMPRHTSADVQRAAQIWGAAETLNEKMGLVVAPGDRRRTDTLIAEARSRIAPELFAEAWAEGRTLSLDEAVVLAME